MPNLMTLEYEFRDTVSLNLRQKVCQADLDNKRTQLVTDFRTEQELHPYFYARP